MRGVSHDIDRDPDKNSRVPLRAGGNTGNAVGSRQHDKLAKHVHDTKIQAGGAHRHKVFTKRNDGNRSLNILGIEEGDMSEYDWTSEEGEHTHKFNMKKEDCVGCGVETRPKNAYVNYIIKI